MNDRPQRIKSVRRPVDTAHLPPIFRMVGAYRNVVPVTGRDLEIMASRGVRLMTTLPPVELTDDLGGGAA